MSSSTYSPVRGEAGEWPGALSKLPSKVRSINDAALQRHVVVKDEGARDDQVSLDWGVPLKPERDRAATFAHDVRILTLDCDKRLVRKSFETEADLLADVRGLLRVHAVLQDRHLASQLCAFDRPSLCLYFRHLGKTAEQLQQEGSGLEARLGCILGICRQLRDLNAAGLGHFDVKPANVMWNGQRACLIDFGSVRSFEELADWYALDDTFRYTERYFPRQRVAANTYVTVRAAFVDAFSMALTCLDVLWPQLRSASDATALAAAHNFLRRLHTRNSFRTETGATRCAARLACVRGVCALLVGPHTPSSRAFAKECQKPADGGTATFNRNLLVLAGSDAANDGPERISCAKNRGGRENNCRATWDHAIRCFEEALRAAKETSAKNS